MLPGIRQLARSRIAELGRSGIGADRIYRTVRDEFGSGYTRNQIREDVVPFRSMDYLTRYSHAFRRPMALGRMFQERPIYSTQKREWLWEMSYEVGGEQRFMTISSDDLLNDAEAEFRAQDLADGMAYGEVTNVRIESRWHVTR